MDAKTIFMLDNLPKLTDKDTYAKCIVKAYDELPLGTPGIVNLSVLEKPVEKPTKKPAKKKSKDYLLDLGLKVNPYTNNNAMMLFPFSVRNMGCSAGSTWHISKDRLKIVDQPLFVEEHVIKEVDCFNHSQMKDEIMELTRGPGISLIIKDEEGIKETISQMPYIRRWFDYEMMTNYNVHGYGKMTDENEEIVCVMSFLNLTDCMPTFNPKKLFGFGLMFSLTFTKKTKEGVEKHNIADVDIVYNKYPDNIFEIDGQVLPGTSGDLRMENTSFKSDFLSQLKNYKKESLKRAKQFASEKAMKFDTSVKYYSVTSASTTDTSASTTSWYGND